MGLITLIDNNNNENEKNETNIIFNFILCLHCMLTYLIKFQSIIIHYLYLSLLE